MDIQELWEKALKETQILRPRIKDLQAFSSTQLPYIILCASSVNPGDTAVRKGEVEVERPSLIMPTHSPQFEGFDFEKELKINQDLLTSFLIIRGARFPSLIYNNKTDSLSVFEGNLDKAIGFYRERLQRQEDVSSGLIVAPEDCWQFSLLIFIAQAVARSAGSDIERLLEDYRKKHKRRKRP